MCFNHYYPYYFQYNAQPEYHQHQYYPTNQYLYAYPQHPIQQQLQQQQQQHLSYRNEYTSRSPSLNYAFNVSRSVLPIKKKTTTTKHSKKIKNPNHHHHSRTSKAAKAVKGKEEEEKRVAVTRETTRTGLTKTEDVDRLLERMGYASGARDMPENLDEVGPPKSMGGKEKQDLMLKYGLREGEFERAERLFRRHLVKGRFGLASLAKVFPNNELANRIQVPVPSTQDEGDFLKFEEYLNIYQILMDLDI